MNSQIAAIFTERLDELGVEGWNIYAPRPIDAGERTQRIVFEHIDPETKVRRGWAIYLWMDEIVEAAQNDQLREYALRVFENSFGKPELHGFIFFRSGECPYLGVWETSRSYLKETSPEWFNQAFAELSQWASETIEIHGLLASEYQVVIRQYEDDGIGHIRCSVERWVVPETLKFA